MVLPGVEISTTEGHLLAIFEVGTAAFVLDEMLVRLGINRMDRGKLDIAANVGFSAAAAEIESSGGLAIAAHVDKPKGLLRLEVAAHLKSILLDANIHAFEVVHLDNREKITNKVTGLRILTYIRNSDTFDASKSTHALSEIGSRRTWIKAGKPDLVGIRHALADPSLRVSLSEPPCAEYPRIEKVELSGGFLDGETVTFCPDLNCLLGGTGAGKSLILEAIRYALHQQVDEVTVPHIWREVQSRLEGALGYAGVVKVYVRLGSEHYRVERVFANFDAAGSVVSQEAGQDWIKIDADPAFFFKIAAFSQGEVLEYSREPVGRMSLVDSSLDFRAVDTQIADTRVALHDNAERLLAARTTVDELRAQSGTEAELREQIEKLAALFDTELVKSQDSWTREQGLLRASVRQVSDLRVPTLVLPGPIPRSDGVESNNDIFEAMRDAISDVSVKIQGAVVALKEIVTEAQSHLVSIEGNWSVRFENFKSELDAELSKIDSGLSLSSLRTQLGHLQSKLATIQSAKGKLQDIALPALESVVDEREKLLEELHQLRLSRRRSRRERVSELNAKTAGIVRLDVPDAGDASGFRDALNLLKIGSRVKDDVLDAISNTIHPFRFVRSLWGGDLESIVSGEDSIDLASVTRFLVNIEEKNLWLDLLKLQEVDVPDMLTIKFKKPDDGRYVSIEALAHGQKCTAILVILLADGTSPVIVDQPEDALHAPWIEDYLVDRLRSLRGSRQYIFATRSPGIVVSGDAEQIITMQATSGRGRIEAVGSLERYDLNRLALRHLEGGPVAFNRRTLKLSASTSLESA